MKPWDLFKVSFGATSWMTIYMNVASFISGNQMRVIRILGSLITNETYDNREVKSSFKVKAAGSILHYSVGALFVYCYHLLWKNKVLKPTIFNGIALGFINGIIGAIGWKIFISLHPNPPKIPTLNYLTNILLAHLVFGGTAVIFYRRAEGKHRGKTFFPYIRKKFGRSAIKRASNIPKKLKFSFAKTK